MTYSTSGGWSHWDDHWTISHYILPGLHMFGPWHMFNGNFRPYFVGIFPYIGLTYALYMVGTSNLGSWNGHWYVTNPLFLKLDRASLGRQGASPESDTPRTPSWRHFPPSIWRSLCSVRCGGQDRLISEEWCRMVKMWNVKMMTLRLYGGWNYSFFGVLKKNTCNCGTPPCIFSALVISSLLGPQLPFQLNLASRASRASVAGLLRACQEAAQKVKVAAQDRAVDGGASGNPWLEKGG